MIVKFSWLDLFSQYSLADCSSRNNLLHTDRDVDHHYNKLWLSHEVKHSLLQIINIHKELEHIVVLLYLSFPVNIVRNVNPTFCASSHICCTSKYANSSTTV